MLMLAFRNLVRQMRRTFLTLTAIVMGVVGIVLAGGFVEDIFVQLGEFTIHSQLGHLQVYKKGFYSVGLRDPYGYLLKDGDALGNLRNRAEIAQVMKRLRFSGLANNGRSDYSVIGEGVEASKESHLGSMLSLVEGRKLEDSDNFGILVGKGVAKALNVRVGDYVTLLANTPEGALNSLEFEVVGVFQSLSKDFDDRAVRIPLAAAQELLATSGFHALVIELNQTKDTDRVLEYLRGALPSDLYEIKPWHELADFYKKTVQMYKRQFGVLQIIILIMVLLGVANSVNMAVYERIGEFGTLMALGNRRWDIFRLVVTEYFIMGIVGSSCGLVLGVILAAGVSMIGIPMPPPPNSDLGYTASIRVVPNALIPAFLVGMLGTFFAVIIPATRVSRLSIVDALRANV
jgi:putative ABC transport system permease protein